MTDKKKLNATLKQAYKDWGAAYKKLADMDYAKAVEQVRTSGKGGTIPAPNKLLTYESQQAFRGETGKYKDACLNALAEYGNEIEKQRMEAPSEEAVRALTVLSLAGKPDDITKNKENTSAMMQEYVNAYGQNYITYTALKNIAKSWGLSLNGEHPLDAAKENYDSMVEAVKNTFDGNKAMKNGFSDTQEKIFDLYADGYINPEN